MAIIDATDGVVSSDGLGHASIYETTIGNVPLIGLVCEDIAACGIETAQIVAHPGTRRELGRMIGGGDTWGLHVEYVDAPDGGWTAVLEEVQSALADQAVLVHPGDCLSRSALLAMTRRYAQGGVDAVVPAPPPADALVVAAQRPARQPLVLGPGARELVRSLVPAATELTDLGSALTQADLRLARCNTVAAWRYSGSTESLLSANRMVLDAIADDAFPVGPPGTNRYHGRVQVAPSATVSGSVLFGPLAIGEHAVVEDSYIGPYTSIANDAVVVGTELDNSIVLAGAELRYPGQRIEASIIGAGAVVSQSFELPRGMHLRLSAGSRVTLS